MIENFKLDIKNKEAVIAWLNKIRKRSGDATPLWKAVTPKIEEFVNYEFHKTADGHKLWPRLRVDYLIWKIHTKGVSGIGFLNGDLRDAAGVSAKKEYKPLSLRWELNTGIGKVNDYVWRFNYGFMGTDAIGRNINQKARPIYKYTALRVNNFLKLDAKKFKDGKIHASFTYKWFRNVLEEGYK
jgi:hypothetical protein